MREFLALYNLLRGGGNGLWWSLREARRLTRQRR